VKVTEKDRFEGGLEKDPRFAKRVADWRRIGQRAT
jgi:hypothetical protein